MELIFLHALPSKVSLRAHNNRVCISVNCNFIRFVRQIEIDHSSVRYFLCVQIEKLCGTLRKMKWKMYMGQRGKETNSWKSNCDFRASVKTNFNWI